MDSTLSRQIKQAADWILASQHLRGETPFDEVAHLLALPGLSD